MVTLENRDAYTIKKYTQNILYTLIYDIVRTLRRTNISSSAVTNHGHVLTASLRQTERQINQGRLAYKHHSPDHLNFGI